MKRTKILTATQARQKAIDWQKWVNRQNLSYQELSLWSDYFSNIAKKYKLVLEFKENGII